MFETLSERLSGVFDKLTRRGALTEEDVDAALREVRVALLEADVPLPVVRQFVRAVRRKATGQAVMKSVTPGQQVVKIVHDELVRILAGDAGEDGGDAALRIDTPPAAVMMVGLQGSGKTTTSAKIAKRLQEKAGKKVLLASLDTRRPAAMEQLEVLGRQAGVDTLPIVEGQSAVDIARRARSRALLGGYDVYILDTAGRLHIDAPLMAEVAAVRDAVEPSETLLVVDSLTGQDAVNIASEFSDKVGITGVVLTRMDGDARGGAALAMRTVTGKPIKFIGTGEKLGDLETFDPARIAGRILGMGDIVALVEKARETIEAEEAERMIRRLQKGRFNMNDLKLQLEQMLKMGGMQGVMAMMPGMGKMAKQIEKAGFDDRTIRHQIALINSMTRKERANPQILQASRKKRIARGAGLEVSELNRLLKMHRQMADMMKKMGRMGGRGMLKGALGSLFGKGLPKDLPPMDAPLEPGALPPGLGLPGGMPGAGGGLPAMPGLGGKSRKARGRKRR